MRKTLAILPGLRWFGKIAVLQRVSDCYLVDFDVVDTDASLNEKHVMDRATLTAAQLKAWTGYDQEKSGEGISE